MSHLKSLTFCPAPPKVADDPTLIRRQHLIERLEEQRALAKDPNYAATRKRTEKDADGKRVVKEVPRRVKPWWKNDANGLVVLTVRRGFKVIEFEKGKPGIVVGTKDKLDGVLAKLIEAARAGELDTFLEKSSGKVPPAATKKRYDSVRPTSTVTT